MRKLASIQKISKIENIPGADNIVKATILGWECIIRKNDFNDGDLCVFFEIDSILPIKPEFEFLKNKKYRVKTIKLRGQISQGLCLPLSILPKGEYKIGDDVTDIIGVKKYDTGESYDKIKHDISNKRRSKIPLFKFIKYNNRSEFPKFIPKTDEIRIQLLPDICNKENKTIFIATEKLDGTSYTAFLLRKKIFKLINKYTFGYCSRNFCIIKESPNCVYSKITNKLSIKNKLLYILKKHNLDSIYIQGEIIGPNIQGNPYKLKDVDLYIFNVFINNKKLDYFSSLGVIEKIGLKQVPLINDRFVLKETINECVNISIGNSSLNVNVLREGIVVRNYDKNISFKIINPEYLLEHESGN